MNQKNDTKETNETPDLAKIREALKAQRVRLRTNLKGGRATCGNYNLH